VADAKQTDPLEQEEVMSGFSRVLIAIVVAGSVGLAAATAAQTQTPPTPGAEKPATGEQKVEGQIKSIDPSTKEVTLADGTKLVIPAGAKISPDVKAGANVVASYKEEAGKKVLTRIELQPSASPPTAPPAGSPKR
jgi:Cu/Ag efflux protein CusF